MGERESSKGEVDEFMQTVEEHMGPVVARFTPSTIPDGGAPINIREQWIGVELPVREHLLVEAKNTTNYFDMLRLREIENPNGIPVFGLDALDALRTAGRTEAADYWDDMRVHLATLVFRGNEGSLEQVDVRS
jgi:hypothetical protein